MKTGIIGALIVVAIIATLVNYCLNQKAEQTALEAKNLLRTQVIQAQVSAISTKHNANTDWDKKLSQGDNWRMSKILTIELEALWKGERPVLYACSIKDISSAGAGTYLVQVEQNLFLANYYFYTPLRMSLTAPREMIDSFLKKNPGLLTESCFSNGITIVAKIDNVTSTDARGDKGEVVEIKTGEGQLLDLVYTSDVTISEE